jgi:hypothetical protein
MHHLKSVIAMSENKANSLQGENRGVAFIIMAISFNIVGLGSLAFGNVPVAGGLLVGSLAFMILSLFYSTKEYREMRKKQKNVRP